MRPRSVWPLSGPRRAARSWRTRRPISGPGLRGRARHRQRRLALPWAPHSVVAPGGQALPSFAPLAPAAGAPASAAPRPAARSQQARPAPKPPPLPLQLAAVASLTPEPPGAPWPRLWPGALLPLAARQEGPLWRPRPGQPALGPWRPTTTPPLRATATATATATVSGRLGRRRTRHSSPQCRGLRGAARRSLQSGRGSAGSLVLRCRRPTRRDWPPTRRGRRWTKWLQRSERPAAVSRLP
mmetsp:Transcript_4188/g.17718  ORF Transcript_4188/g.17718 Transcript_4188/m.17718 type:complete len:241 (+) Transcript_4188:392-1114(+)